MILLLAAQLTYVGSQACAPCHQAIHRAYLQTPMARSSGAVTTDLPPGQFRHQASGVTYRISGKTIGFGAGRSRGVDYYIGSGAAGRSYLFQENGFLFQAPVTWYAARGQWDVSPGQETSARTLWNRPIEPNCLYCHATRAQAIFGTQNRYASPPFLEDGVGCERCHGPGSEHVARGGPIVNPSKLETARREAVCAQCHLTGEARINRPGKQLALYRPGDDLYEFVSYFVCADPAGRPLTATSHVESLARSACRLGSGGRLWCGTCHDPHTVPAAAERELWYREKCLGCHQPSECRRGPDCAGCHMPRVKSAGAGHGVFTDHRIARRKVTPASAPDPQRLIPFQQSSADERALGLAYAEVALETGAGFHRAEALRLLRSALPAHPQDADLMARLAYLEGGSAAEKLYEQALRLNPAHPAANVNLGLLRARKGDLAGAVALWRAALKLNPGLSEASVNLAAVLGQGAEAVLREARRYDPDLLK